MIQRVYTLHYKVDLGFRSTLGSIWIRIQRARKISQGKFSQKILSFLCKNYEANRKKLNNEQSL